ncbi:DUF4857 domain-containing protein [Prolixibacteraceae bacterium JC049]|nr:DUF4857 domain-containing protein [Prolixibacteraceae bacterium JC049]
MKIFNRIIILIAILAMAWGGPKLFRLVTDTSTRTPFVYYSCVDKTFCQMTFSDSGIVRSNKHGKVYNESEFDSILPMFYYRQLLAESRMPDTIKGKAINMRFIRGNSFFFRYRPNSKYTPSVKLFPLFEAIPKRLKLELPEDVFRMNNGIEFIQPETNELDVEKSKKYTSILLKKGYQAPARLVAGNPSTRKSYDNGYFIVDKNYEVFHLKQLNNRPFIKKTNIPANLKVKHIKVTEYASRAFYGFLWDKDNKMYLIHSQDYELIPIPTPPFNLEQDNMVIMANPFYWNISVINNAGKTCWAIDIDKQEKVDDITCLTPENSKVKYGKWIFPFELRFLSGKDNYVKPRFTWNIYSAIPFNLILMLIFVFIQYRRTKRWHIEAAIWTLFTGIFGLIACLFLKNKS